MTRRRVYESGRFVVAEVDVPTAEGPIVRTMVVHPGSVTIVPVLDDGRIVLIRNRRFTVGRRVLELCAGTREPGEDALACAHRELAEETGYRARTMTRLVSFLALPGMTDERMEAFVATGLEEVGQSLERDEDIEVVVHSVEELDALMRDGTIEDGKTLATLLYYLRYGRHLPQ